MQGELLLLEKILLNPAAIGVLGVIVGSGISLLGTILSQIILSKKEQKQWENQHNAEKELWERDEEKKEKEYLREIYQNSLRSLSLFMAQESSDEEKDNKQHLETINDIHKWSTILLLRHSSSDLGSTLDDFTSSPSEYRAKELKNKIIDLIKNEEGFFLNNAKIFDKTSPKETSTKQSNPDLKYIQITIDNDYRKKQLIEGTDIPQRNTFEIKFSDMSNSQREKLTECFFQSYKTIPANFTLYTPTYNKQKKDIIYTSQNWQAKLDPKHSTPQEILSSWESDFEKGRIEAELEKNKE